MDKYCWFECECGVGHWYYARVRLERHERDQALAHVVNAVLYGETPLGGVGTSARWDWNVRDDLAKVVEDQMDCNGSERGQAVAMLTAATVVRTALNRLVRRVPRLNGTAEVLKRVPYGPPAIVESGTFGGVDRRSRQLTKMFELVGAIDATDLPTVRP